MLIFLNNWLFLRFWQYSLSNHLHAPGYAVYKNIDVFVLSSNYEPFGIVLLEAMSMSIPIVSSDAEGPSEIFKDNQDCVSMFAKGDEFDLAEKLKTALQNIEETQNKTQKAWNLCQEKYTLLVISKILDKTLKTFVKYHKGKTC